MRVSVVLLQKDLLGKQTNVIADGPGLLNGNRLIYTEKDTGFRNTVTFGEEELVFERGGDFPSRTVLPNSGTGVSTVNSPYGQMVLQTKLKRKSRTKNLWMAEYQVLSGKEVAVEQILEWQIRELN